MDDTFEKEFSLRISISIVLVVCFLFAIFLPVANMFLHIIPEAGSQENRRMSVWPTFSVYRVLGSGWQREVDIYLNDHFGLRSNLVKANAIVNLQVFGISPSEKVLLGKDGWFFYAADHAIEKYRGMRPFTEEQLQVITEGLERRQHVLEDQGIEFVVLFAPNKHTIYPEHIPDELYKIDTQSRLDQLVEYIQEHTDVLFVDPREKLLENKKENVLYLKTDTHWNELGSFIAYGELMSKIHDIYPEISPLHLDDFEIKNVECRAGDLAALIFLRDEMKDSCMSLKYKHEYKHKPQSVNFANPKEHTSLFAVGIEEHELKKVVVFRDSFFNALTPYFSEHFERSVYVWDYEPHQYIIDEEKPDIVVLEILERFLDRLLPEEMR